jgi:glycerol-3-phosphate dehydrogenase
MPTPQEFNVAGRREALTRLGQDRLDLLVVGGGITGCGLARDAALRGWTVGLVEKEDFGFGASSRSSKIVHGGVRYLEYGHFLLVKEAAQERAVLRTIAPHLVHPLPFVFPVSAGESLLKIRAGLTVFDFLAASDGLEKHENLSPEEVRQQLPGLRDPLKGAVRYPEYITDDARLTLENAQSAAEHGASVVNHARVQELRMNDGRIAGCSVVDLIENRTVEVSTKLIVNATGAWSSKLLEESDFDAEFSLIPSKGIHILFSAQRLPIEGATFLRATNGKRGLAMRRLDFVYVGTTDDEYDGSLDRPRATRSNVDEVLNMVSDCFPKQRLGYDDILATWAGVRPLIREEGKSTRDTSREDAVWHSPPGLITVAGGKLTTYRQMARRVLELADPDLGPTPGLPDRTATVPLPGAVVGPAGLEAYHAERSQDLVEAGVAESVVERLCWLYGKQLDDLLASAAADPSWLEPLHPDVPALRGEVLLAVEREMALTLVDFMDRRAALLLFSPNFGLAGAEAAADIMAEALGWDAPRKIKELAQYRELAAEHAPPSEDG